MEIHRICTMHNNIYKMSRVKVFVILFSKNSRSDVSSSSTNVFEKHKYCNYKIILISFLIIINYNFDMKIVNEIFTLKGAVIPFEIITRRSIGSISSYQFRLHKIQNIPPCLLIIFRINATITRLVRLNRNSLYVKTAQRARKEREREP